MSRSKRDSAKVRRATHSGSWYSEDADELDSQLSNWLSKAQPLETPARAIIAPHAGYYYSGATAAYSYRQMDPSTIPRFTGALCDGRSGTVPFVVGLVHEHRCKRVFILGPSHHVRLSACALTATEKYQTPFYELVVDTKINEELFATGQFETMHVDTDEDEHSIEMHLPYIAKVMESRKGHFTVIPVLVGSLSAEKEQIYGRIFSKYLSSPENFFVISSDFCHWGQRFHYTFYDKTSGEIWQSIEALDKMGMEKIENMDPVGFSDYLRQYQNTICGRFPIGVMLNAVDAIRQNGNGYKMSFKFVKYAQSSQCKSMRDSSVSYAAGALIVQ